MAVLVERVCVPDTYFCYEFYKAHTKIHKVKVLGSLWPCIKISTHFSTGVPHTRKKSPHKPSSPLPDKLW